MVDVDCRGTIAVATFMTETSVDGVLLSGEALAEFTVSGSQRAVKGSGFREPLVFHHEQVCWDQGGTLKGGRVSQW